MDTDAVPSTGLEAGINGTLTLQFNDGSAQVLAIPKNAVAGVQYFWFTDAGASISSVTFNLAGPFSTRDIFGVDDVRFSPASVPEPSTLLMAGTGGLIGIGYRLRRRRGIAA